MYECMYVCICMYVCMYIDFTIYFTNSAAASKSPRIYIYFTHPLLVLYSSLTYTVSFTHPLREVTRVADDASMRTHI